MVDGERGIGRRTRPVVADGDREILRIGGFVSGFIGGDVNHQIDGCGGVGHGQRKAKHYHVEQIPVNGTWCTRRQRMTHESIDVHVNAPV